MVRYGWSVSVALSTLLLTSSPGVAAQAITCIADCRTPEGPPLSLAQIRITIPENWPPEARAQRLDSFKTALVVVRSCDDADTVANAFGGTVLRNDTLTRRNLPPELLTDLDAKPIGRPSEVIVGGTDYSVIVRCA